MATIIAPFNAKGKNRRIGYFEISGAAASRAFD
jgi:hypothetical protein